MEHPAKAAVELLGVTSDYGPGSTRPLSDGRQGPRLPEGPGIPERWPTARGHSAASGKSDSLWSHHELSFGLAEQAPGQL